MILSHVVHSDIQQHLKNITERGVFLHISSSLASLGNVRGDFGKPRKKTRKAPKPIETIVADIETLSKVDSKGVAPVIFQGTNRSPFKSLKVAGKEEETPTFRWWDMF